MMATKNQSEVKKGTLFIVEANEIEQKNFKKNKLFLFLCVFT